MINVTANKMSETNNESVVNTGEISPSHSYSPLHSTRKSSAPESRSRRRKASQRLMLAAALGVSLLLLLAVSVFAVVRIGSLVRLNNTMESELFKVKQQLSLAAPELERSRKELAAMIKGRLPHLRELAPDKVIEINNSPFKNVVFTVLNQNGKKRYEFKLVMENKEENLVQPDVRIFVFDQHGVQVGMAEITDRVDLMPGESRSYSSVIDRFIDEEPRYFFISRRGGAPVATPAK